MLTASDLFPIGLALGYLAALTLDTTPVCRGGPDASACELWWHPNMILAQLPLSTTHKT